MPIVKKQMLRIIRLVDLLRKNCYPNCSTIAGLMWKLDIEENLNVACSAKTIYRDIQTLKNDFNAPIEFDPSRNGYFLTDPDWKFPGICLEVPEISADCLAGTIFENVVVSCDAVLTRYIRRYPLHCQQHLEMLSDGSSLLRINRIQQGQLVAWIMRFTPRATVVAPQTCRRKICDVSQKLISKHLDS